MKCAGCRGTVYLSEAFCPTCGRHQRKDRIKLTFMVGFSVASGYWAYKANGEAMPAAIAAVVGAIAGRWLGGRVAPKPAPDAPSARSALAEYHRKAAVLDASRTSKPDAATASAVDKKRAAEPGAESPAGKEPERAADEVP